METRHSLFYPSTSLWTPIRVDWDQDRTTLYAFLKKGHTRNNTESKTNNQEHKKERKDQYYLCRQCDNRIAKVGDEVSVGDIPIETMQLNPHGYIHEIFTIRTAFNVIIAGSPNPADSWFPGYMWRLCLCAQCSQHLGWSYQTYESDNLIFFGLRRGSVKEE